MDEAGYVEKSAQSSLENIEVLRRKKKERKRGREQILLEFTGERGNIGVAIPCVCAMAYVVMERLLSSVI